MALPTRKQLSHEVWIRRPSPDALYDNGGEDGWELDLNLRCDWIRHEVGPLVGVAQFTYIPLDPDHDAQAFEEILKLYTTDDQVRVVVHPHDDELTGQDLEGFSKQRRFEGRLVKPAFDVQAQGVRSHEIVTFTATAITQLDNESTDHLITGRWLAHPDEADKTLLMDGYVLPAVFNFRGMPNRDPVNLITAPWLNVAAYAFTNDDGGGEYWSVAQALLAIMVQWLSGINQPASPWNLRALPRTIFIEQATVDALTDAANDSPADRWVGLHDQLPEVNVHGLGLLDAIDRICQASDFQFACAPLDISLQFPYELRIWRRHTGPLVYPGLAKRGTSYPGSDPFEDALAENDVSTIVGMVDRSEIANEVIAVGRTFVEARFYLLPAWNASRVDAAAADSSMQTVTPELLAGTGYHAKHVVGGSLFTDNMDVGRHWIFPHLAFDNGYDSQQYDTTNTPLNFLEVLGFRDEAVGPGLEWIQMGNDRPIVWIDRIRHPLPLVNEWARSSGREWIIEVSEDGGLTREFCPYKVRSLPNWLGIELDVPNLAAVNNATLSTGIVPPIEKSWWALIKNEQLIFWITCAIEADHGTRFVAKRRATSGSQYRLGRIELLPIDDYWLAPDHFYSDKFGDKWTKITVGTDGATSGSSSGAGSVDPGLSVRAAAERRRDALEDGVVSATLRTWVMDLDKYKLGDLVGGIRGRDVSFAINLGSARRYPNIVGITIRLGDDQSIELSLDDHRFAAGR